MVNLLTATEGSAKLFLRYENVLVDVSPHVGSVMLGPLNENISVFRDRTTTLPITVRVSPLSAALSFCVHTTNHNVAWCQNLALSRGQPLFDELFDHITVAGQALCFAVAGTAKLDVTAFRCIRDLVDLLANGG
jgi:hypothetical protein